MASPLLIRESAVAPAELRRISTIRNARRREQRQDKKELRDTGLLLIQWMEIEHWASNARP